MSFQAGRAPRAWVPAAPRWPEPGPSRGGGPASPTAPAWSARAFQVISAVLLGAILVLSVVIGIVVSWPTTPAQPHPSAVGLRTAALRDSTDAGWVHVSAPGSVGDVGTDAGSQVIESQDQGSADVVFVGGVAYLRADATFLVNALALPPTVATAAANRWLSFRAGDPDYRQVADGLTVQSLVADAIPSGPVRLAGETTMDGQRVVGLAGVQNQLGGVAESQTAWVSASSPHRIVASVAHARNNGISVETTVRFSHWGEQVSLSAPDGSVPFVSIGGATPVDN